MTDQERKAMEMALEALETFKLAQNPIVPQSIYVLRKALAQPEQEPYCWVQSKLSQGMFYKEKPRRIHTIPLYTAPPSKPWVSLTDEESSDIYNAHHNTYGECITSAYELVLDVEAKLKEKNT